MRLVCHPGKRQRICSSVDELFKHPERVHAKKASEVNVKLVKAICSNRQSFLCIFPIVNHKDVELSLVFINGCTDQPNECRLPSFYISVLGKDATLYG